VADEQYVPTVHRSESHWSTSQQQEAKTVDEIKEQQLVTKV